MSEIHPKDTGEELLQPSGEPFTPELRWTHFEYIQIKYKDDRRQDYPDIGEQLDMLWHELKNTGSISVEGEWFKVIDDIKIRIPKPE